MSAPSGQPPVAADALATAGGAAVRKAPQPATSRTAQDRPLRAGLVGLGMMGRNHARVLADLDGVELVAVADAQGDRFGAARGVTCVPSLAELLAFDLDYVVIAAPTALHAEQACEAAAAGVPAFIEKPLAADVAGAEQIAAAFESAGVIGAVGHIERYNPALQQLRARLEMGALGDVYQVITRRQGPFPGRIADVGVVKDLATHDFDLTAWVIGQPYEQVAAQVAYKSGREHEDLVAVTGKLAGGVVTSHLVNWLSPMKERVTMVTGEKGAFVADTLTADLTLFENGTEPMTWTQLAGFRGVSEGDITRFAIPKPEPLRTEHEAFRDAVLGAGSDIVTLSQGLATVRVADAVLRSAAIGQTVEL